LTSSAGGQPKTSSPLFDNFRVRLFVSNIPSWTIGNPIIQAYNNITFNITDNMTFQNINNMTISCNNSYSQSGLNSPFIIELAYGSYNCSFTNISYYSNSSIFIVNSSNITINLTLGLIYYPCNITFNVKDSQTLQPITNINMTCNTTVYSDKNSPFMLTMPINNYNCFLYNFFYNNANISFGCTNKEIKTLNYTLDRLMGLSQQEYNWLKTTYLLANVQSTNIEIMPTNYTCIDNFTIKKSYLMEICLDNSCNNLTMKQTNVHCPYGCEDNLGQYGADCIEPNYVIIFEIIIGVILLLIFIAWAMGRRK